MSLRSFFLYILSTIFIALITFFVLRLIPSTFFQEQVIDFATITKHDVSISSTVSGIVEIGQYADLAFPTTGTIQEIMKQEGDFVSSGDIIASLTQDVLISEYTTAINQLHYFESLKQQIIDGPRAEAKAVTDVTVEASEVALAKLKTEQEQIVKNAYIKLLSSDLEAIQTDIHNNDTPPVISGNYLCTEKGTYQITIFKSNSSTGYSYRLSGLETGTYPAWTESPGPLGSCGLFIQFSNNESYRSNTWEVSVPNLRAASYVSNNNAYLLAEEQKEKSLSAAESALALAKKSKTLLNAEPTTYELEQANSKINEAKAIVSTHEARIANYVIRAPFDGTVTNINMDTGEVSDLTKTIKFVGNGTYSVKATIPEADIKHINLTQQAFITFDASPNERFPARINFISPLSVKIGGVSYYEAHMTLLETPSWIREGLNADIEIIMDKKEQVLSIPKQYLEQVDGVDYINVYTENVIIPTPIETGLIGTDGYVEVLNLPEGTHVILPNTS